MKLEAHYGFRSDFCNAAAGWEKGGIENAVAILRRIAFTPMPRVKDLAIGNSGMGNYRKFFVMERNKGILLY